MKITGRVQGVFFRAHTTKKAVEFGLAGWVKNMPDGSVEIHAEGPEEQLKKLEQWCWEGSPSSKVTSVVCEEVTAKHHRTFESDKS